MTRPASSVYALPMSGPIRIYSNTETELKHYYRVFLVLSLLLLSAAIAIWILLVGDQLSGEPALNRWPFVLYILLLALALLCSAFTIMARTGARWNHVSHFLVTLPIAGMMFPVVGTILCGYCLKKIAGPELPELMFSRKPFRRRYRGPDMHPRVYTKVPFRKSNIPGIASLSFIIATHVFYLSMSFFYAITD